jgi:hypothetical protein
LSSCCLWIPLRSVSICLHLHNWAHKMLRKKREASKLN